MKRSRRPVEDLGLLRADISAGSASRSRSGIRKMPPVSRTAPFARSSVSSVSSQGARRRSPPRGGIRRGSDAPRRRAAGRATTAAPAPALAACRREWRRDPTARGSPDRRGSLPSQGLAWVCAGARRHGKNEFANFPRARQRGEIRVSGNRPTDTLPRFRSGRRTASPTSKPATPSTRFHEDPRIPSKGPPSKNGGSRPRRAHRADTSTRLRRGLDELAAP